MPSAHTDRASIIARPLRLPEFVWPEFASLEFARLLELARFLLGAFLEMLAKEISLETNAFRCLVDGQYKGTQKNPKKRKGK